jgi:hypothetical protein
MFLSPIEHFVQLACREHFWTPNKDSACRVLLVLHKTGLPRLLVGYVSKALINHRKERRHAYSALWGLIIPKLESAVVLDVRQVIFQMSLAAHLLMIAPLVTLALLRQLLVPHLVRHVLLVLTETDWVFHHVFNARWAHT